MDTTPPLLVEDQTDEDFFDKLVDDDEDLKLNASSSQSFLDGSDSDEVKAFANLSIGDVNAKSGDTGGEVQTKSTTETVQKDVQAMPSNTHIHTDGGSLVSSNSFGFASVDDPQNDNSTQEIISDSTLGTAHGSLGSGVKELQWSAFNTDSEEISGNGFGSYMDFFNDLGESAIGASGNLDENPQTESKIQTSTVGNSDFNENNCVHNPENQDYLAAVGQNSNQQNLHSTEYWESMYPGWKYDSSTGQWYQVNENNGIDNTQNGLDSSLTSEVAMSESKSEVSYLQQTAESYVETIPRSGNFGSVNDWKLGSQDDHTSMSATSWHDVSHENGATESISSWNDVSPEKNEYPAHMVFDPQYPGWYYDMITQEWRTLESYTASEKSTIIGHDQINQNGYGATGSHTQFDEAKIYGSEVQVDNHRSEDFGVQANEYNWAGSLNNHDELGSNIWQPHNALKSQNPKNLAETQQMENAFGSNLSFNNKTNQQNSYGSTGMAFQEKGHTVFSDFSSLGTKAFLPTGNLSQQHNELNYSRNGQMHSSSGYYGNQNLVNLSQEQVKGAPQFSNPYSAERSSAGRPPHALATFGFGGKLIVMKTDDSFSTSSYVKQSPVGGSISLLNLMDVLSEKTDSSRMGIDRCEYFNTLCRQSFPGPLVGGNIGGKDLNKWIDERIANCATLDNDFQKGEVMKLLLSLLKIACQHYGKLRSPLGTDLASKDGDDAPETAVAKLFSSAKGTSVQFTDYGALSHCLLKLPPEGQMQATAAEVQSLLVSGKKKEALHCASEGQLWGPALVLAAQLGDQFYVDIVKKMALRQLAPGSPLRTLCLLIAGQPADIFSEETPISSFHAGANVPMQSAQYGSNGMLEEWKENLALITSNRTKDDELVLIHLGDCLWKDRSDIIAAHICYIVAEANFEAYSNSARVCLIGADHWKFPRTYASPAAIQRTEFYEYSKVLGNPQFILLPFQPYKLIYAYMLAEIGKVPESLKYCQAISKSLRTGRSSEVETWRQLVASLEERIRTHQQGGYSTNLAAGKLVGKLLNLFDNTAQRVVGGLPPPVPSATHGNPQRIDDQFQAMGPRVSGSQSTMAMSSLMPSASMEPINEWTGDGSKMSVHNRSVSEPDFGRTPRQVDSSNKQEAPSSTQSKAPTSEGVSRFGRFGFGSQLFQKTVGLVLRPRQEKQAKLGDTNKFYYDEKLKRWVEEGAEVPAEEIAPPPPPTIANFQNGGSDYNLKSALNSEGSLNNGNPEYKSPNHLEHTSGMPPIPPTSNQFSARGRMGVRSRYVDTFNKGGGYPTNLFQSPSVPSVNPVAANPKFFVPSPVSSSEQSFDYNMQEKESADIDNALTSTMDHSLGSPEPVPPVAMQRFPSMNNIAHNNNQVATATNISHSSHSRRTASWSGSFSDSLSPTNPVGGVVMGGMSPSSSFMPIDPSMVHLPRNGGSFGDDLQEVEL